MDAADVRDKRRISDSRLFWPVLALLLLLLFNAVFTKNFFHLEIRDGHLYGIPVDILHQGSKAMLLAIGMTLVIATGGVDLSVGSVMAIAGAVAALLVTQAGIDLPFIVVAAVSLLAAMAAGLGNGILVAYARVQPIVATLILMVAGRGIATLLTGEQIITFGHLTGHEAFIFLGNGHFLGLPLTVTIVAVVFLVAALLTRRTAVGLFIESVGDNETASTFSGVNARVVKMLAYGFCGLCAGMAGLIAASGVKAADSFRVGEFMELDAIFAVVVGGTALTGGRFTLTGSLVGAILLQTLSITMIGLGMPSAIAPVPKALVIIGVCLLQSERFRGHFRLLFGRRTS